MDQPQYPMNYIPPEIWAIIFDKIQGSFCQDEGYCSTDLYNCSRVCVSFQNILELTKVTWLFEKVIPSIAQYLTGTDILNCRIACKTWKHAIDHYLENYHISGTRMHRPNNMQNSLIPTVITPNNISRFLHVMEGHHGNPFPGRMVCISHEMLHPSLTYYDIFWDIDVDRLLKLFGNFIHHLHLKMNFNDFEDNLRPCIQLTPNLKSLSLEGVANTDHDDDRIGTSFLETLPPLSYLEALRFESRGCSRHTICSKIPAIMQCSIASQYIHQLKQLIINFTDGHYKSCGVQNVPSLPILEDLHIILESSQQLRTIFPAAGNHSKVLRRLTIKLVQLCDRYNTFDLIESENAIRLGQFLRPLVQFGDCLHELAIISEDDTFNVKTVLKKDLDLIGQFTCVRRLNFEGFWFGCTHLVDRLPTTLEYLHVTGIKRVDNKYPLVQYVSIDLSDQEKIASGSIFECLPKLRELRVRDHQTKVMYVYRKECVQNGMLKSQAQQTVVCINYGEEIACVDNISFCIPFWVLVGIFLVAICVLCVGLFMRR